MVIDMCFLCFSLTNRKKKQTRTENKTHRERTFSVEWLRGEFIHRKIRNARMMTASGLVNQSELLCEQN